MIEYENKGTNGDVSDGRIVGTHAGIKLEYFIQVLKSTYCYQIRVSDICNKVQELEQDEIIREICNELRLFVPKNFEEYVWLQKVVCGVFLLESNLENRVLQADTLRYSLLLETKNWDVNPVHIHFICKEVYSFLSNDHNLIFFVRKIFPINCMGSHIATSLIWALLFRIKKHDIKMFRFHKMSTLIKMLPEINFQKFCENPSELYKILLIISFMQNALLLRNKLGSTTHYARFKQYFKCSGDDEKQLLEWCKRISLEITLKNTNMPAGDMNFEITSKNPDTSTDNMMIRLLQIRELIDFDILYNYTESLPAEPFGYYE